MQLRGALFKKLVVKEPSPKTRTGQALYLLKKNGRYLKFHIQPTRRLIKIPIDPNIVQNGVTYPLIEPYAYARIFYDTKEEQFIYSIIEPRLTEYEEKILKKIKVGFVQIIDVRLEDIEKNETIIDFLEQNVKKLMEALNIKLGVKEYSKIMYYIYRDYVGLNKIEPFFSDPYIEDIGCDGTSTSVYIVHQKFGSMKTNVIYNDEQELKDFVTKLAERCDRYISYAEPLLDGTLRNGARVQASLSSDVTTKGPTFSIRKFREAPFSPTDIIRLNTASPEMMAYLWFIVENGSNVLIVGGVATGKTTILNCISVFIPPEAKIVSIEDTRELDLPHENWIPGVSRTGFTGTGTGEVTMFELLKESFRQNPDYLIVGEVRGKEAYVMFQGMASGHPTLSTMHAGSVDDLMKRLQTKPINISAGLVESLDVVIQMVHAREKGKSARRVKEIIEIRDVDKDSGNARVNKVFSWMASQDEFEFRGNSWLLSEISKQKGIPMIDIIRDLSKRKTIIEWLSANNIIKIEDVSKYISMYHKNPAKFDRILSGEERI